MQNDFRVIIIDAHNTPTNRSNTNFQSVPEGLGHVLRKIKEEYDNPPVYIMENGYPDVESFHDHRRIQYLHSHLKEILLAVNRDDCNVQKYTVWSLMDNFEWNDGYNQ